MGFLTNLARLVEVLQQQLGPGKRADVQRSLVLQHLHTSAHAFHMACPCLGSCSLLIGLLCPGLFQHSSAVLFLLPAVVLQWHSGAT
jgi:hypothetical protein